MNPASNSGCIVFENVSKFYGEVLGVNRVSLNIAPGITSLVGPNGSGKTTLMNLMTGLIAPTQGRVEVLGISPRDPERLFRIIGYCAQWDSFPKSLTGYEFIRDYLRLHGLGDEPAHKLAWEALARVDLTDAGERKIAGYSKGMRQRVRLAQALAHRPTVLVLDEPLNGLDPMARAETIALFESLGKQGMHVIISSHILEEVDRISDSVVLMASGYVVAEGNIPQVRQEVKDHPVQVLVRCSSPSALASRVFIQDHVVEAKISNDGHGLLIRTRNAEEFYKLLNHVAAEGVVEIETVAPADEDVNSIYQYLIGSSADGGTA
jgi:ABC-2 type transport system ATP-binding protein